MSWSVLAFVSWVNLIMVWSVCLFIIPFFVHSVHMLTHNWGHVELSCACVCFHTFVHTHVQGRIIWFWFFPTSGYNMAVCPSVSAVCVCSECDLSSDCACVCIHVLCRSQGLWACVYVCVCCCFFNPFIQEPCHTPHEMRLLLSIARL